MEIDTHIDKIIEEKLLAKNAEERANHISSGKLSAGMLGDPIQWQILKVLGAEPKELEEYAIRKFLRGKQVEEWVLGYIPDIVAKQKFVEYRECIGYMDCLAETKSWDWKNGEIPIEVKSVMNSKWRRIMEQGPDESHILQACLYALAENKEHFAVLYVSAEDYRVKVYIFNTADYKEKIDGIIDRFYQTLKSGVIPKFEPIAKWQSNKLYNKYPDWSELNEKELLEKSNSLTKSN